MSFWYEFYNHSDTGDIERLHCCLKHICVRWNSLSWLYYSCCFYNLCWMSGTVSHSLSDNRLCCTSLTLLRALIWVYSAQKRNIDLIHSLKYNTFVCGKAQLVVFYLFIYYVLDYLSIKDQHQKVQEIKANSEKGKAFGNFWPIVGLVGIYFVYSRQLGCLENTI